MGTFSRPIDDARLATGALCSDVSPGDIANFDRQIREQTSERNVANQLRQLRGRHIYAAITANDNRLDEVGK